MRILKRMILVCCLLSGCSAAASGSTSPLQTETADTAPEEEKESDMKDRIYLKINDVPLDVTWENNASVQALTDMVIQQKVTIQMHLYGGFEQNGKLPGPIVSNDMQMTSSFGDIFLYQSDSIVIFRGENTWDYTKLGHIDTEPQLLKELLSSDAVLTLEA
jgi:hypothetical protein